jgi:hypothetical protein
MPILTVGNQVFSYPNPGEESGWGEDATGWAEAVTEALSALISPGDILPTSLVVQNKQSSPADVTGLFFNSDTIRAANINYAIYRVSTSTNPGIAESGTLMIDLNDTDLVGQKWKLIQIKNGDAGVAFSVTDGGQIQYLSTDIGLTGYTGVIDFSAKVLTK